MTDALRLHTALAAALGGVLLLALAAPLFVAGASLALLWWAVAGLSAVTSAAQVLVLRSERRSRSPAPAPAPAAVRPLDFDRPWRGGPQ